MKAATSSPCLGAVAHGRSNREEAGRLYLHDGQAYTVTNDPPGPAR